MFIIVETDDLRPETVGLFEKHFDELKKIHKELQVTAYVPAFYQEFGIKKENNIEDNKDFYNFWKKRKDWLKIALHGTNHQKPPEYLREKGEQIDSITKSLKIMEPYLEDVFGFKAPFYRMNDTTLSLLKSFGIFYYVQWWNFVPLKVNRRPIHQHVVLGTHCGTKEQGNYDNIDLVHDHLDLRLCDLESKGYVYSNFNSLMRGVL